MHCKYKKEYKYLKKYVGKNFPTYNKITKYLKLLTLRYPDNVCLESIGNSYEGRPIYMVVLKSCQDVPKDGVMVECGIHAKEWLTHTTALYIIEKILRKKELLQYMDFYIIPCLNPDGYVFSHTSCRLWKKNTNRNCSEQSDDWGVNLNRNFSQGYRHDGNSSKTSNLKYRGQYSLSEPESKSLASALSKYAYCFKLYISLRCYGQLIMYPWGFQKKPLLDEQDLYNCATKAQQSMKRIFPNSKYKVGQLSTTMYVGSRTSVDYARGVHNIKFTYTYGLPRGERSGFTPDPSKIQQVAKETMVGIDSMVKFVKMFYCEKSSKCKLLKRKRSSSQCSRKRMRVDESILK